MEIDQKAFFTLILWSLAAGAALGVVYDVFRIRRLAFMPDIRLKLRSGKKEAAIIPSNPVFLRIRKFFRANIDRADCVMAFFEDIVFALIAAVVMSILTYKLNRGEVRWFSLFAALIGFTVYYETAGRLVRLFAVSIIKFIRAIVRTVLSFTLVPVLKLAALAIKRIQRTCKRNRAVRYTVNFEKRVLEEARNGFTRT